MSIPQLYRQLQAQLSQWICPQDQRHLQVFCDENVAAILQAQSACVSHWLPYLSHRGCKARSHMEQLNYFVHNPKITAETFYFPLLQQFLSAWEGMAMMLTLDTSVLWEQYCLIEVCLIWGGRSIPLGQRETAAVATLLPPEGEAYLFGEVTVLQDIQCHLATAHLATAPEPWTVLSDVPPSLQTFEVYGQRFGGIEPHFKDYKSSAFELIRSHLRDAQALNCLLMLLASATLIAVAVAVVVVGEGRRKMLDWHSQRGLSFLQLGLREIERLCYQHLPIPHSLPYLERVLHLPLLL
jgi:hypothetical protein